MTDNNVSASAATRRVQSLPDLVIASLTTVGGIAVIIYASGMPRLSTGEIGSGLFPTVIGIGLVLFGAVLTLQSLRPSKGDAGPLEIGDGGVNRDALPSNVLEIEPLAAELLAEDAASGAARGPAKPEADEAPHANVTIADESRSRLLVNALVVGGSVLAYILLADVVGFLPLMFVILLTIQKVLGGSWLSSILVSAGFTAVLYLVFEKLLLVQLPDGFVGI